jgi:hypothetical protein
MIKLDNEDLKKINAGGISFGLGLAIAGAVVFIIGVVDGFVRPLRCN